MRRYMKIGAFISVCALAVACNTSTDTNTPAQNEPTPDESQQAETETTESDEDDEEAPESDAESDNDNEENVESNEDDEVETSNEEPVETEDLAVSEEENIDDEEYTEEQVSGGYLIYTEVLEGQDLVYSFVRTPEDLNVEDRFHQSLMNSDQSQQELFSNVYDFELDGTTANFYYDVNETLSMASSESLIFWSMLDEIGFRFGVEEANLFNQDGERGLQFAENEWNEPIDIENKPNRGYYVLTEETSNDGEPLYISGAVAEEETNDPNGEAFTFEQTLEAMTTVQENDDLYQTGIYEGLTIQEAELEDGLAMVRYEVTRDEQAPEEERIQFEHVVQLVALDFQAKELQLINETDQVISIYPLNELADPSDENVASDDQPKVEKEDVSGLVYDYIKENDVFDTEEIGMMVEEREGEDHYAVAVGSSTTEKFTTYAWYQVDKETGEVEERE
ncbi:hypothetical protein ACTHQ4_18550 [Alkalicoccobacillus gibsonii]|uniref:hypothetical protein n=1 Tax=Alkalicoccobacillus gibsonii TaxID=79881 RepID=UPI003F7CB99B